MMNKQKRSPNGQAMGTMETKRTRWLALIAHALVAVMALPMAASAMTVDKAPAAAAVTAPATTETAPETAETALEADETEANEPAEDPAAEAAENAALDATAALTADDAIKALVDAGILDAASAATAKASLESENGRTVYEIVVGQAEYKVDAQTGEIVPENGGNTEYEG